MEVTAEVTAPRERGEEAEVSAEAETPRERGAGDRGHCRSHGTARSLHHRRRLRPMSRRSGNAILIVTEAVAEVAAPRERRTRAEAPAKAEGQRERGTT